MNKYKNFFNMNIFSIFEKNKENRLIKDKADKIVKNLVLDNDQEKLLDYINSCYIFPKKEVSSCVYSIIRNSNVFNSPILKSNIAKNYNNFLLNEFEAEMDMFIYKYIKKDKKYSNYLNNFYADAKRFSNAVQYINEENIFNEKEKSLMFLNKSKLILRNIGNPNVEKIASIFLKECNLYINKKYESDISNEHNQELNQFNKTFQSFENMKKTISKEIEETISKFDEKDLPLDSKKIILEIKNIFEELSANKLNVQQSLFVQNLYEKRLPQILKEYITVSPRYKEKLQSHNENIDCLLIDSLNEIKNKMTEISDEIQSENFNKVKVTHKYLKSV